MKQGHSCATQVCPGHGRRVSGHFVLHPLALALACLVMPEWALALPEGFNPVSGLVNQNLATPGVMNLQQGSDRAIVNWNSFNIGQTESVNISQPNVNSAMLNRVTGGVSSSIAGSLTANGRVFLVNPSGVVFGAGSRVSTGGLVASTLDISDDDFNNGRWNFSRDDNNPAQVINLGDLHATNGGTIALLGASVTNGGTITADRGTAALVSSKKVNLDFFGDGLTTFDVPVDGIGSQAQVVNTATGLVQADGGQIKVFANSNAIAPLVVNQQGVLRARSLEQHGGDIFLAVATKNDSAPNPLGGNRVEIGGTLDASGTDEMPGGQIRINGGGLYLNNSAVLNVSGASGGSIAVSGKESVALAKGSKLSANALVDGKGGEVNIQGGLSLRAYGTLQAQGAGNGAGGRISTSARAVDLAGLTVQAGGAPGQSAGTWLVNPFDIRIVHLLECCTAPPSPGTQFDLVTQSLVYDSDISAALNSNNNIVFQTGVASSDGLDGNIFFAPEVDIRRQAGSAPLELRFNSNGWIMGAGAGAAPAGGSGDGLIDIVSGSGPLNVFFNTDANYQLGQAFSSAEIALTGVNIKTGGGSVYFYGQSDLESGAASGFYRGVDLENVSINTKGVADNSPSGNILIRGRIEGEPNLGSFGVGLAGVTFESGEGNIFVRGENKKGTNGLVITYSIVSPVITPVEGRDPGVDPSITLSRFTTGSGDITFIGVAGEGETVLAPRVGLSIDNTRIKTISGKVELLGRVVAAQDGGGEPLEFGLILDPDSLTTLVVDEGEVPTGEDSPTAGDGVPILAGGFKLGVNAEVNSSSGNLALSAESAGGSAYGLLLTGAKIDTGNNIYLSAKTNDPAKAAIIVEGNSKVEGRTSVSIRPGGVSAEDKIVDDGTTLIQLGNGLDGIAPFGNFQISQKIIDQVFTPLFIIGSNRQSGSIVVAGNTVIGSGTQLTLQAEGSGGSIDLRAPLTVTNGTLSLLADGQISQSNTGTLTSQQLLAISHNGSVLLNNPANAPHVIAGRAAGDFSFTNVDDLSIGTVEGTSGIQAGTVSINTLEGNLSVDQAVTAEAGSAVLDSAGTLDVNAPVSVANGTLSLAANGQINQSRSGTLTSEQLLAISRNGSVLLNNTANGSHVLAGSAAQNFAFTGSGNLNIGTVGGTSGLQAGTVSLRNLAGDLSLDQAVTATAGTATLDSAGSLNISAPVSTANGTLTLAADGQISQGDNGTLISEQLLATSRNGSVLLNNPANATHIVAGSAAQAFAFTGASNLSVGAVGGTNGVRAGTVALRNLAGDMSLDQAVTATAGRAVLDSAGAMAINAPVSVPNGTLSLTANGQISQADSGAMTSEQLLAVSRNASVVLNNPANAPHVVAGRAAGDFAFTNADNLSIGTVDGVSGVQAGSVFIRNLDGDLTLDQPVTATSGSAVLVTGGRLQNPAGQTISASTFWQIWANTWIGENRGGLVGSGRLPNLYGCAFGGNCASAAGLATTAGDNHFLYLQQPTAQVTITSGSGTFGVVPQFRSSISGLILGDSGNGISGSPDSAFSQVARPGTFSVGGTYTSAEGYLLTVVPGTWTNYLVGAVDARPDWTRERPDTWLYDHNMGGSPMCAAPGVTVASAVQQGDVLAREWSLVKSRPKLSSCVASDKQNGCSDF